MKKLRIGYFADGPWSHKAFEYIISDNDIEIAFITPRYDTTDSQLKDFSVTHNIPYIKFKNVNHPEALSKISSYDCDLLVSMSFNQIFKKDILTLTKRGVINCHAGKLPFYRGRNILNWALINDEKEFGITVHFVDEGIDTGDIIMQRCFPITEKDTYKTLLDTSYTECAQILYDSLQLFKNGVVNRTTQSMIHPLGFYCGKRGEGDEIIDWNQNSRDLFNFIRSICDPGPKATTYLNGKKITINTAVFFENASTYKGIPGQILKKTDKGYLVKSKDSFIEIQETTGKINVGKTFGNGI